MGWMLFIGVITGIILIVGSVFNTLVRRRNMVTNAFAQIDVQLKRRYDLIPNLVNAAKAYMEHEQETLTKVISARNHAVQADENLSQNQNDSAAFAKLVAAENNLNKALMQFSAVSEQYPELKADLLIQQLMEELSSTENRIAYSRQNYNDSVMFYNNSCQEFPSNFVAGAFNFKTAQILEIEQSEELKNAPVVSFK